MDETIQISIIAAAYFQVNLLRKNGQQLLQNRKHLLRVIRWKVDHHFLDLT